MRWIRSTGTNCASRPRSFATPLNSSFTRKKSIRRRKDFVESLQQLQDALGELNDIAVNEKLLEQLGGAKLHGGRISKALVGRLSAREEARIVPVLKEAERAYATFAKMKPFWV